MGADATKSQNYLAQASRIKQAAMQASCAAVRDQLLHIAMLYEKLALIAISEPVARAPSPQAL